MKRVLFLIAMLALIAPAFAFVPGDIVVYSDNTGAHVQDSGVNIVFGAKGDGVTDNCTAITNAVNAAAAGAPLSLTFGPGTFLSSCAISSSGRSITIQGAGKSATTLEFTNSTNGITVNTSVEFTVDVENLSLQTTAVGVGNAISITYAPAGFANRDIKHVNLSNVLIKGVSQATEAWNACVSMTTVSFVNIDNTDCLGSNGTAGTTGDAQSDNTNTPYGFLISDVTGINPGDFKFTNVMVQSVANAIYIDNNKTEGVQLIDCSIIQVGTAVHWYTGSANQGRPQFLAVGNNLSVYVAGFDLRGVTESAITQNLFYHNPGSTSAATLIQAAGVGGLTIAHNQLESFVATATASTTGIVLTQAAGYSVTATYATNVRDNIIGAQAAANSFALGIKFDAGAAQDNLGNNWCGSNVTLCVEDVSGTAAGQQLSPGRRYIQVKLSAPQSINNATATSVAWDTIGYQTLGWTSVPGANVTPTANQPFIFARCYGQVEFTFNATGTRTASLFKNGVAIGGASPTVTVAAISASSVATDINFVSGIFTIAAGDNITVSVSQTSGGALNLDPQTTWLECEAIE